MNVMAEAHKRTKAFIAKGECLMSYAAVLRVTLRHCHSENKAMNNEKAFAIKHFEDVIAGTLVHFEKLGVNDYYIAVENNAQMNDYTILAHKVEGDTSSPLGWSNYANAIVTHSTQADEYVKSFPGVVKLHAQTYLSKVIESFRDNLEQIQK